MKINPQQQPGGVNVHSDTYVLRPSRRTFTITAASLCGAAAFWSLRHPFSIVHAKANTGPVTIVEFSPNGKEIGRSSVPRVVKSEAEWRKQLSPLSYQITRHEATEEPFTGEPKGFDERGIFNCICCDTTLFNTDTMFESGTGWPSFWQPIAKENVVEINDESLGMTRTAVACRRCNAHLGHVFNDGPPPTGLRYCMNWAAMRFIKRA